MMSLKTRFRRFQTAFLEVSKINIKSISFNIYYRDDFLKKCWSKGQKPTKAFIFTMVWRLQEQFSMLSDDTSKFRRNSNQLLLQRQFLWRNAGPKGQKRQFCMFSRRYSITRNQFGLFSRLFVNFS